jgi:hypothetical membrane protein
MTMTLRSRLWFGLMAVIVLWTGFLLLPLLVPGYDWVRQTVSEIGQRGSPMRVPFTVMLCVFAACLLVFAWGLRDVARKFGASTAVAYVTGFMAISSAGVGIFAYPHPLHGDFGLSEIVGYQTPWVLALTWRRAKQVRGLVTFSWLMTAIIWCAILANLGALDFSGWLWHLERPVYGIVQRSLFFTWSVWLAGTSLALMKHRNVTDAGETAPLAAAAD